MACPTNVQNLWRKVNAEVALRLDRPSSPKHCNLQMPHIPNTIWHRNLQDPNTSIIKTKTLWRSRCGTSKSALLIPWRKEQLGKWEETQLQKEVRYKRSKERQNNEWQKQFKNKENDKTGEGRRWHCRRSVADNNEYTMQGRQQRKESNHGAADLRNILREKEPGKLPLYSPTASAGRAARAVALVGGLGLHPLPPLF